ncbi:MAG: hypothetical protein COA57_15670 [Flavobacteriales bacterium]|nr:MAG: hypothetical protein COA57_15670 [Flavobacteriales bacterium]
MAEYLDNDEDSIPDNQAVVDEMVSNGAFMAMFSTDGSNDQQEFFDNYNGNDAGQDLYGDETHPSGSSQSNGFDATLEEVLHLITSAGYSGVYPSVFGEQQGTSLCNAMDIARGGQFTSVPNNYPTEAWYHYDDQTCDYGCMATEYIYWSLTSILGAQNYSGRCNDISVEWELCTKTQIEATDTSIYKLLTDPQYKFATILPDGIYCPTKTATGVKPIKRLMGKIYPNPSNGIIKIDFPQKIDHISVYDSLGKLVYHSLRIEQPLDLSFLNSGLYHITFDDIVFDRLVISK